jgi:hypothetical protein
MKAALSAVACVVALSGCAVYPAYGPAGGVYVAPAPVVVYPSYGYAYGPRYGGYYGHRGRGHGHGHGHGHGYRGWR